MGIDPYVGQLGLFAFGFAPKGWAVCAGQLLPISQYQALFSLLGTNFGGDGRTTFGLPNLQARTPVGFNTSAGLPIGQVGGEEFHTLTTAEVPEHSHTLQGTASGASSSASANHLLGATSGAMAIYNSGGAGPTPLTPSSVTAAAGSAPHENRTPFLVLTWCISLFGIFPSRS